MSNAVRLFVGSLVPLFAATIPLVAAHGGPYDLIDTPIGTDLMLDIGFGSGGSTIMNFNDAAGTWDQPVRVVASADGGTWVVGFHRPNDGSNDEFAMAKLRADGTAIRRTA